jgi:disulfide oxidoreductase YuzD
MNLTKKRIKWLDKPEEHDYDAACDYLSLITENAKDIAEGLKNADMSSFKAKDIFRASTLSLLGISNSHIQKNIRKLKKGKKLSPILLVRDDVNKKVIVADGYHRLCTVYMLDEDAKIPCKIVGI